MRTFLELLYGDILDGSFFHTFTIPRYDARFFDDTEEATAYIERVKDHPVNVYYSVGLMQKPPKKGRGTAEDVTGLIGLWLDIDLQSDAKKSDKLPKNEQEALAWLEKWFPEPTVVVHTGHGLHPLWLFREPWIFDNAQDKKEAQSLVRGWIATGQLRANEQGWTLDHVKDITRILRMPGTWNIKENKRTGEKLPAVRAYLHQETGVKYNPSDLWNYVAEDAERRIKGTVEVTGDIRVELEENVEIPPSFEKLSERSGFVDLWNMKDKDKGQDLSRYDLALANHAVAAGLSNQEIADILVCFRRKHAPGDRKILERPDYVERTIKKARADYHQKKALENLEYTAAEADAIEDKIDEKDRQETKESVLSQISYMLGIRVTNIIRHPAEEPIFRIVTPKHNIMMGDVSHLLEYRKFRAKLYAHAGHFIPPSLKSKWNDVAALFPKVWEDESIGDEATEQGGIRAWISDYLIDNEPESDEELIDDAIQRKAPVEKDGEVFIFGEDMRRWLLTAQSEKVSAQKLGVMFRSVGMERKVLRFQTDRMKKASTRSAWQVPADML